MKPDPHIDGQSGASRQQAARLQMAQLFERAGGVRDLDALFDFLMKGYRLMSLTCVSDTERDSLCFTKAIFGVWVTLIDDLSDNPTIRDDAVIAEARHIPFDAPRIRWGQMNPRQVATVEALVELGAMFVGRLHHLPHFDRLAPLLAMDIRRIHSAAEYAALLGHLPYACSFDELWLTQHATMTLCPVGVMDLMATSCVHWSELGPMRTAFLAAQRAARLSNVLTTYEREELEGDITNELRSRARNGEDLGTARSHLEQMRHQYIREVEAVAPTVETLDVAAYARSLHALHEHHLKHRAV